MNYTGFVKVFNITNFLKAILFFAVIIIVIDLTKMYTKCPKKKVIYRYIPRSFEDEQDEPVPLKTIFGKMFDNPSPWINSFTERPNINESIIRQN
mgnify:CR=1 FL=1